MLQILTPAGELVGAPPIETDLVRTLYRSMVEARTYDHKCTALQKQGRLATYAPFEGQEAAQVGSAAALEPEDWMVATYRDAAAMWMQGYPWELLILGRVGDERGGLVSGEPCTCGRRSEPRPSPDKGCGLDPFRWVAHPPARRQA